MTQKVLTVEKAGDLLGGYQGEVFYKIHMNFWCPKLVRYCTVSLRESDIYVSMVKIWLDTP